MTMLTNGRIHTMDAASAVVDTLVIRDGRVEFAGRRGDVNVPAAEPAIDYASHQEAELGALAPGRRADLIVCSDDVFTCAEERIKDIVPVLTMVGGEAVSPRPGTEITAS